MPPAIGSGTSPAPVHARRAFFLDRSLDQSYHSPPLYPIKCMNDIVPIKHS
jgi:hypothetical protein